MSPLPHDALLSTLAEMSITVVGFSLVFGVLRPQSKDDEIRLFTLRDVAEIGLACSVMCVFPLVAHTYGSSDESVWRLASGLQVFWATVGIALAARRRGAVLVPTLQQSRLTVSLLLSLTLANYALALTNVTMPSSLSGARYVSCMLIVFAQAGFMFLWAAFDMGRRRSDA